MSWTLSSAGGRSGIGWRICWGSRRYSSIHWFGWPIFLANRNMRLDFLMPSWEGNILTLQYLVGNRYVSSPLESKVVVGIPLTGVDERRGRSRLERARGHKNRVRCSTPYRLFIKALDLTDKYEFSAFWTNLWATQQSWQDWEADKNKQ